MNILFLALDVDVTLPRGDGVHVSELAGNLASLGHRVRLVTSGIGSVRGVSEHYPCPGRLGQQIRLCYTLARNWADIIYERRTSPKVSWAVSRLTGVPFVVEVNAILEDEISPTHAPPRGEWWKVAFRRHAFRSASRVVAVSSGIADHLRAEYGLDASKVLAIPNGVNTTLFYPMDRQSCRVEIGVPSDGPLICFVGNLTRWQGLPVLLGAARNLKESVPRLRTLIVGDGPEKLDLTVQARALGLAESVIFAGSVPYNKVAHFIGAADICVAPFEATRKASPIKLFEYLACRRPIVASAVDDVAALLQKCGGGVAVKPEDVFDLERAVRSLLDDPGSAAAMAEAGYRFVTDECTWTRTAAKVAAALTAARRSGSSLDWPRT